MARFNIKQKKVMPKRSDGLSSVYNQQHPREYERTWQHIVQVIQQVAEHADISGQAEVLYYPLKGFPRKNKQPNYTPMDIFQDLIDQHVRGEDFLDSKIDRWNRLFRDFPAEQVIFDPDYVHQTTTFNELWS